MRILVITSVPPYPPNDGGKIRVFELIKRLAGRHELVLATLLEPTSDPADLRAIEDLGIRVVSAPQPLVRDDPIARLRRFVDPRPRLVTEHYSPELANTIERVGQAFKPDLVHCEQLHVARYARPFKHIPSLLVQHVARYEELFRRIADARPVPISRLAGRLDALKIRRYERQAWRSFTAIAAVSEEDRAIIRTQVPATPVYVIPNGVDTEHFRPGSTRRDHNTLVMTGTVGYYPNLDGIRWFVSTILPALRRLLPGIQLCVVGQLSDRVAQQLGRNEGLRFTGRVQDVRPYVARSSVFVVPLRIGGGTRLKVLEAMAQGIPIVSTSVGCEGLGLTDGEHLLVADDPDLFVEKTMQLLKDEALRERLARGAREYVVEHYDWARIVERLDSAYAALAAREGDQVANRY